MAFVLFFTETSEQQLKGLRDSKSNKAEYKAVVKTLRFPAENPRHPGLNSQPYRSLSGPDKEPVFESYAQHRRPSAYRVFWYYGPGRGEITILNIVPHP